MSTESQSPGTVQLPSGDVAEPETDELPRRPYWSPYIHPHAARRWNGRTAPDTVCPEHGWERGIELSGRPGLDAYDCERVCFDPWSGALFLGHRSIAFTVIDIPGAWDDERGTIHAQAYNAICEKLADAFGDDIDEVRQSFGLIDFDIGRGGGG
ncbi:hypothetical protein [Halococcus saccharolyticus]|uniref:Uncharacterized protein n=1 Tax=Halococcus saccharolyticus DSM 5350 TaxID=1227455 RepID=M0MRF4_9EURY|nr:hypothetical protein [Halococcus saccharolyticus]EMA47943.1 hypothetical protein C449_00685 [Halococcus saccharolyticus DSM 5350]